MSTRQEPAFFRYLAGRAQGSLQLKGLASGWIAPIAFFETSALGEEGWTDSIPETVLALCVSGTPVECLWGARTGKSSSDGANFVLNPRHSPVRYRSVGPNRFFHVYLPDAFLDRCAHSLKEGARISGALRDDLAFVPDRELETRLSAYAEAALRNATVLEMESRAMLLAERLLCNFHGSPHSVQSVRGGLAPWQVRRVTEYLAGNLRAEVSLANLASLVDLSAFHFARAFKRSIGSPPHAYHRALRLEEAKRLLVETELSITDIAMSVGYEAPQTLARVFQREIGISPTYYRRERRR